MQSSSPGSRNGSTREASGLSSPVRVTVAEPRIEPATMGPTQPPKLGHKRPGSTAYEVELAVLRDFWQHKSIDHSMVVDPGEPGKRKWLSLKDAAEFYFRNMTCQLGMLLLSIISCVLFIVETYLPYSGMELVSVTVIEALISVAFLADFVLSIAFALDRWAYLWSLNGAIDFLSILPVLPFLAWRIPGFREQRLAMSDFHWIEISSLCRVLRSLKVFRVMRLSTANKMSKRRLGALHLMEVDSVQSRIIRLVFWLGVTIFIAAGVVWYLEKYVGDQFNGLETETFTWFDCFYYVTTTLATVGYGDVTPRSQIARAVVICLIFFFLAFIPYQIGKLVEAFVSQAAYRTACFRHVPNTDHILVLGHISYGVLTRFVSHFLHGDHVFEHHFRLVILSTDPPDTWVQTLLNHPRYHDRVQFLQGAPWNPEDLMRAGAEQSKAIFILADLDASDITKDQDRILLTAVSVRKYLIRASSVGLDGMEGGPGQQDLPDDEDDDEYYERQRRDDELRRSEPQGRADPLRMLQHTLFRGRSRSLTSMSMASALPASIDEEVSARIVVQAHTCAQMEEMINGLGFKKTYSPHIIRLRLMAYATVFPGLVSFFNNLMRTDPLQGDEAVNGTKWFEQVSRGASHRVVRTRVDVPVDSPLRGRTFAEVARFMYRTHQVVLVGVEIHGVFLMNPHRRFHFLLPSVAVYAVAPSAKVVREAFAELKTVAPSEIKFMGGVLLTPEDLDPPRPRFLSEPATRRLFSPLRHRNSEHGAAAFSAASQAAHKDPAHPNHHATTGASELEHNYMHYGTERPVVNRGLGEVATLLEQAKRLVKEAQEEAGETDRKDKIHRARELLDRALVPHHLSLPERISKHVVIGLCSMDERTVGWLLQYVAALRKLVHLPIVVLGVNIDRYYDVARRVQSRLAQSYRHPVHGDGAVRVPSAVEIFLVEGSPQSKADLERCRVQHAHAVVLLGDGVGDKDEAHDPVLADRPVLLSTFSLETVLRCGPERHVLTLVDLRSESNASLLRQRYRTTQNPGDQVLVNLATESLHEASPLPNAVLNNLSLNNPHSNQASLGAVQLTLPKMLTRGSRVHARMSFSANPVLAAGKACCRSFFDVLFVSFYQSPTSLRFWREVFRTVHDDMHSGDFMWGGGVGYEPKDQESGFNVLAGNGGELDLQATVDGMRSVLDMIHCPADYVGRPYMELVDALLANDIVTLGLYRKHGTDDAPLPYAVVNPPGVTVMSRRDQLYILRPWCSMPRGPPPGPDQSEASSSATATPSRTVRRSTST